MICKSSLYKDYTSSISSEGTTTVNPSNKFDASGANIVMPIGCWILIVEEDESNELSDSLFVILPLLAANCVLIGAVKYDGIAFYGKQLVKYRTRLILYLMLYYAYFYFRLKRWFVWMSLGGFPVTSIEKCVFPNSRCRTQSLFWIRFEQLCVISIS